MPDTTATILASDQVSLERDAQPERSPLMFDPWLTSSHNAVVAITDNIIAAYPRHAPHRRRRMREQDRRNLETVIRTVLANLAYASVTEPHIPAVGISLRRSKRALSRYDRKGFSGLPVILERLALAGILALRKSWKKGIASQITANQGIVETLQRFTFGPRHFMQAEGPRETIWLSRTERDYIDGTTTREMIEYADTAETRRYRAEMDRLNAFLADANLRFEPDGGPLVVTSAHRHLSRYFKLTPDDAEPRFDLGGRLFGGWWQGVSRDRRHAIRINGEPIADLDFASMFLRLAYLKTEAVPPEGDLYAMIPGLSDPRWRDGVKKTVSAMLFRNTPLTKVPRDLKDQLPPRITGHRLRSAILAAHPTLASVFETGIGLHLMFIESQILVAALLHLTERRIPALPMHDGIMVARSSEDAAIEAMTAAAAQITGSRLPITPK